MVGSGLGERKRYSLPELKKRLPQVAEFKPWWQWGLDKIRPLKSRKDTQKAFVPIMKGCNNYCSYCVVPYAKGKEKSLPFEGIVCQVEELAEKGWEHIVLLGQNVNSYGKDFLPVYLKKIAKNYHISIYEKKAIRAPFALLLRAIHPIKDIKKISFLTSNPWDLNDEIIQAMRLEKIDRYLHLPVQSGDDRILKKMNRPYTAKQYLELVEKIRQEIPDIQIGTDIIVGFPGETKKAFQNTVELCSEVGFKKAYIAKYSPRSGTFAFKLKNNVSPKEKKRRWQILEDLINF
jgi:tRNA-2-methylthio-N6-dimethylallyladenosine synthase